MTLTWYDGKQWPKSPEGVDLSKWHLGTMFIGEKGILVADYGRYLLLPEAQFKDFQATAALDRPIVGPSPGVDPRVPSQPARHALQLRLLRPLVEHNLLGTVAFRTGTKLEWDAEQLKATNCPAADRFIRKSYRAGWTI